MTTKYDIINAALRALGSPPVTEGSGTYEEQVISDIYDMTVEQVMIEAGWHCLRKRASLIQETDTPSFGFAYSYKLPGDIINILSVNEETYTSAHSRFTVEGSLLLTDATAVNIIYTSEDIPEEKWDKHLTQTVKAGLKVEIALNQSAAQGTFQLFLQQYEMLLRRNRARNSQFSSGKDIVDDTLLNVRYIGRNTGV